MKHSQGFTLIEALVVLVIFCIIGAMAASSWQDLSQRAEARSTINLIVSSLYNARNTAITRHTSVSLCGSSDGLACNQQWQEGVLIFVDRAGTGTPVRPADILGYSRAETRKSRITWRGFGSGNRVSFNAWGRTASSNGSFTYCAASRNLRYARQIVINRIGRVRFSRDRDGDGTHESASGQPLTCADTR